MAHRMCPVDVISVCRTDGGISPLRFRLSDIPNGILQGEICRVLDTKQIHFTGAEAQVFICEVRIFGKLQMVELKYHIRSHTWWLVDFLH